MNYPLKLTAIALSALCFSIADIGMPTVYAAPEKSKKTKAPPSGGEWGEIEKHRKNLARKVASNFKTWKSAEVDKFLKDDENRSDLASWYLIQTCDVGEDLKALKMLTKKSVYRRFLAEFAEDTDWIEGYLYSAPPKNVLIFLQLLKAFADKDPEVKTDPIIKKIATTTAGEFTRRDWLDDEFEKDPEEAKKNGPTRIYNRFKFFSTSWRKKRLNILFDDLDYWDMRIITGVTGRTNNIYFGSEASLRWGQDNVKLPEAGYASPRDIFQMPYRLWNKVGDSVHSSDYYAPFMSWYKRNQLKRAREVGCVCGGVSHYGASAACANGIPAVTMGEPGHCAFAVRVEGKWRDNNSIVWDRGVHWRLWDENSWSFLHLTQAVYGDKKNTPDSFRIGTLAKLAANLPKPKEENVLSLYQYALKTQPLNFPIWRDYLEYAKEQNKGKEFWAKAHKKILESFLPAYPDCAATLLGKHLYPTYLPLLEENNDEKLALFAEFWEKVDGNGVPGRWDFESVWNYQIETLGDGGVAAARLPFKKNYNPKEPKAPGSDPAKQKYKEKIGGIVSGKKEYSEYFKRWKNGESRDKK